MLQVTNAADLKLRRLSIMVYGASGIGKTTLAGMLPGKTLLLDIDHGCMTLKGNENVDVLDIMGGFAQLASICNDLRQNNCYGYRNIVLDTLSSLESMELSERGRIGAGKGQPTQADYGRVYSLMKALCLDYIKLPRVILFLAHEKPATISADTLTGDQLTKVVPKIGNKSGDLATEICGLCDIVARCMMRKTNDGKVQRYLAMGSSPTMDVRDRIWKRTECTYETLIPQSKKEEPAND